MKLALTGSTKQHKLLVQPDATTEHPAVSNLIRKLREVEVCNTGLGVPKVALETCHTDCAESVTVAVQWHCTVVAQSLYSHCTGTGQSLWQ